MPGQHVDRQVFAPVPVERRFIPTPGDDLGQPNPTAKITAAQDNPACLVPGKRSSDSCVHAYLIPVSLPVEPNGVRLSLIMGARLAGIH